MENESRFWRSTKGADEFDRLFSAHKSNLIGPRVPTRTSDCGFFLISEYDDYPHPGLKTLLSGGLSSFILRDENVDSRGSRIELAWTIKVGIETEKLRGVIEHLADQILGERSVPPLDEVLIDLDQFVDSSFGASRSQVILMTDHWFDSEEWRMESYFPFELIEMVALTRVEADQLSRDPDHFYEVASESGLDGTDLFQPSRD